MLDDRQRLRRVRVLLGVFIVGLVLSGLTAFPLGAELELLARLFGIDAAQPAEAYDGLRGWIATVAEGLRITYAEYPFVAYGTDWLAFGHLAIAVFFIGPWRDPVRNVWVIDAGMIACVGVLPVAFIAGEVREIPLYWRLIDCSFGVLGFLPLWWCRKQVTALAAGGEAL